MRETSMVDETLAHITECLADTLVQHDLTFVTPSGVPIPDEDTVWREGATNVTIMHAIDEGGRQYTLAFSFFERGKVTTANEELKQAEGEAQRSATVDPSEHESKHSIESMGIDKEAHPAPYLPFDTGIDNRDDDKHVRQNGSD